MKRIKIQLADPLISDPLITDNLITEHPLYIELGKSTKQRCERYKEMFEVLNTAKQDSQITEATIRGEVYGSDEFHRKISKLISRSTKLTTHGVRQEK